MNYEIIDTDTYASLFEKIIAHAPNSLEKFEKNQILILLFEV